MPAIHVIANPNARSGRGAHVIPVLEAELRKRPEAVHPRITEAPGDARRIARELCSAPGTEPGPIVVVGGDGTVHEVVNGLRDASFPPGFPLVLLPVGTGNDFHRMLRARGGVAQTIEILERGEPRSFDVGEARWASGDAAFVNLLGVGIDVAVLERRGAFLRLPGLLQYGAALMSALRRFRPVPLGVEVEGAVGNAAPLDGAALLAAITVGPSIGGGFLLSPRARPDDGLLDLVFAESMGALRVMRHLPGLLRGTIDTTDRIHRRTFTMARFEAADECPFNFELDGELMPDDTPWLEARILPGVLTLLDLP